MIDNDGAIKSVTTPFQNESDKLEALIVLRAMMRQLGVIQYSFLSEAWAAAENHTSARAQDIRPSERSDRIEVVVATASDGVVTTIKLWGIVRNEAGKVIDLKSDPLLGRGALDGCGYLATLLHEIPY